MAKLLEIIKSNKNDIIKPVAVLLAICIIIPLALSLTNKITKDKIAELDEKNRFIEERKAVLHAGIYA